jgi:hypothetical protein
VQSAEVEFVVRTMDQGHVQQIIDALAQAGFSAQVRKSEA